MPIPGRYRTLTSAGGRRRLARVPLGRAAPRSATPLAEWESWSPPGAYLDSGGHPADRGPREVREDASVDLGLSGFAGVTSDLSGPEGKHLVTLCFETEHASTEAVAAAPDELTEVGRFRCEVLPMPLFRPFERFLAGEVLSA